MSVRRLATAAALALAALLLVAQPAAASWLEQGTPVPPGATDWQLNAVSCTSPTSCMAVGFVVNSSGDLLTEKRTGSTWTAVSAPCRGGRLDGVSCSKATSCEAVGVGGDGFAIAEAWDGRRWTKQTVPQPTGAAESHLSSVSCTSPSACEAVGQFLSNGTGVAFAAVWNGSSWNVQTTPGPPGSTGDVLNGVSCISATDCEAVGFASVDSTAVTLAEAWDGDQWTVQATPNPAASNLAAVSCTAVNSCTAVGDIISNGVVQTLAEHWDGSNWTVQQTPNPAGSTTSQLNEVSCSSATACTAVGSATGQIWAEAWNGTTWTVQSTPIPAGGSDPSLSGVSCRAPNACTAVGSFFNGTRTVPLADRWNGTAWATQSVAVAPGSTASGFSSVSCPALKACSAVGFNTGSGATSAFAESWNGTRWSIPDFHGVPNQVSSHLSGVSCSSVMACMGVGFFTDGSGQEGPLGERYA